MQGFGPGIVETPLVLVPVHIHRIVTSGSPFGVLGGRGWPVILRPPVVGLEVEHVKLPTHFVVAVPVLVGPGVAEGRFGQRPFAHLDAGVDPLMLKRRTRAHVNHPVEGIGAKKRRRSPHHQVHFLDIQFRDPQEVTQRKIQPRGLVIHSVNQLQRTNRRC